MQGWQGEDRAAVYARRRQALLNVFMGETGLRAGWRALLFLMLFGLFVGLLQFLLAGLARGLRRGGEIVPAPMLLFEAAQFGALLAAAALLQGIEKRPLLAIPFRGAARSWRLLWGAVWGFVALSALVGTLWSAHLLAFAPARMAAGRALGYGLIWGGIFLLVGFFEETLFRGYLQSILAKGLGFWPAALVTSALFGAIHISNHGESHIGILAAALVGLLFCMSLWYTGSLWWAIGFHAAWDWAQSFFYGTADSGLMMRGHLLAEHPMGNAFWSGGTTGPEGSPYVVLLLLLAALGCWAWWRRHPAEWRVAHGAHPARLEPAQVVVAAAEEIH
jgi:membrane protease YdiL (CAAX protease family)